MPLGQRTGQSRGLLNSRSRRHDSWNRWPTISYIGLEDDPDWREFSVGQALDIRRADK